MRPSKLDSLFASLTSLKGIAAKVELLYAKLFHRTIPRVIDMLLHIPTSIIDRRANPQLIDVQDGQIVTITVTVGTHRPPAVGRNRAPYKVFCHDATGDVTLVWFQGYRSHLEKLLPYGEQRVVSGRVEIFDGFRQMLHPDRVCTLEEAANLPMIEPVYPATAGLSQGMLRRTAKQALPRLAALNEWHRQDLLEEKGWGSFAESMQLLHDPIETDAFQPESKVFERLTYDELYAGQVTLALVRDHHKKRKGRSCPPQNTIEIELPFALTRAQSRTIAEIQADLASKERMLRLLQGDVGSGKTIVALMSMITVCENARQAALMAPTEILARQHFDSISKLTANTPLKILLLTGRDKGKERERKLAAIASGEANIVIGTHALFQEAVVFHDLALAIIDEQHRFGVHQRLLLAQKGELTDVLVMTATPIPRTLVMTWFGDMDVSFLDEKPAGRKPIDTRTVNMERYHEVIGGLARKLEEGAQIYWVCPLVEESEEMDLSAAISRFEDINAVFPGKAGLLHGQMKPHEKDEVMECFKANTISILVATTVIEVGVDVPNATIMVIEQSERFGLSQLHQLRGRVGRGAALSTCLLLYKAPLGAIARERLAMMRESEDGFKIAEKDLQLRGQGDILGTKQAGDPAFLLAKPELLAKLLPLARDDAKLLLSIDPKLETPRGEAVRDLLYILGKDEAVKLYSTG